jgi:hypothetical protein
MIFFFIFIKQSCKDRQPWIDFPLTASAGTVSAWFPALRAESLAVFRAKLPHGEGQKQCVVQLLVQRQLSVHNDDVLIHVVHQLFLTERPLVDDRSLKRHHKDVAQRRQASRTFPVIGNGNVQHQAHVTALVGHATPDACLTVKGYTNGRLG